MAQAIEHASKSSVSTRVWSDMWNEIRGYWTGANTAQRFAYSIGFLLMMSGAFHLAVLLASGGSWEGPLSWRKAISFGFSFGISTLSLVWVTHYLRGSKFVNCVMWILGTAMLVEVGLVTMQVWRGVPSHFNFATTFDTVVFTLMGVSIGFVGLVTVALTILSFSSIKAPASMKWAIRIGLLLLLAGSAIGGMIINNGNRKVFDSPDRSFVAANVDDSAIYGQAGHMKSSHAAGLHGIQVLPFVAWLLLFSPLPERRKTGWVFVAAAGYVIACAVMANQTFSGRSPGDLPGTSMALLLVGALALGTAYLQAMSGMRRPA